MNSPSLPGLSAAAWLLLLLGVALGYLWLQVRRSPYSMWENVLYTPTYLFGRLLWRVHFTNAPPAEMQRGAVLVANHRSSVDPFFVQLSAGRRVHWMVAREYCENVVLGPLLRALLVIPTNRSGMDTGATKHAIRLAKEGRLVGMFPEGRLNHTSGPLVSIRGGAALVAVRAGVPLIPLFIAGSPYRREVWSPLFMTASVKITFGQPIDPASNSAQNAHANAAENRSPVGSHEDPPIDGASSDTPSDEQPPAADHRRDEIARTETMMMEWGKQIVTLAGHPNWNIELAGRGRSARDARKQEP